MNGFRGAVGWVACGVLTLWAVSSRRAGVYVVTGLVDGIVKDQRVLTDIGSAVALRKDWVRVYGGRNVCLASRAVENAPDPRSGAGRKSQRPATEREGKT